METKQQIITLLQKSVLVTEESKQKIYEKIEELSEAQLEALFVLLKEAEETQNTLLKQVLEVHPDFLDFIERYTAKQIEKARIEAELQSRNEEEQREETLLAKLEES